MSYTGIHLFCAGLAGLLLGLSCRTQTEISLIRYVKPDANMQNTTYNAVYNAAYAAQRDVQHDVQRDIQRTVPTASHINVDRAPTMEM